jgi:hypothetical protein
MRFLGLLKQMSSSAVNIRVEASHAEFADPQRILRHKGRSEYDFNSWTRHFLQGSLNRGAGRQIHKLNVIPAKRALLPNEHPFFLSLQWPNSWITPRTRLG